MGRKKEKWFKPEKRRGWKKKDKASTRRRKLLASTDKRKSLHSRYLEAGRAIQALANVTKDKDTRKKAEADANYFFNKANKI